MGVAAHIIKAMESSSAIRKAFEDGLQLKKQYGEKNVYDFSLGNPDLEPPEEVENIIKKIASSGEKGAHAYMPNAGYMETRAAMAEKVSQEQGVKLGADSVVMAVGAAGALNVIFKAILEHGDEVIVPAPFFAEYTHYCANHGGKLVPVSTKDDFSLDLDAIAAALSPKTAAVLINSPNNPTGKIYSEDDIKALAALLEAHSKKGRKPYIIADEPYRAITYGGKKVSALFPFYDSAIVASSFAKNLSLPGERIGYLVINPACPDKDELFAACVFATRVLGYVNAPAFFQKVVAQAWKVPVDYSSYSERRDALTGVLKKAGIEFAEPEGAFYLFCKVPARKSDGCTDENLFCDFLKEYRVLAVPGTGFGKKGWFRLAYCVSKDTITNSLDSFVQAAKNW